MINQSTKIKLRSSNTNLLKINNHPTNNKKDKPRNTLITIIVLFIVLQITIVVYILSPYQSSISSIIELGTIQESENVVLVQKNSFDVKDDDGNVASSVTFQKGYERKATSTNAIQQNNTFHVASTTLAIEEIHKKPYSTNATIKQQLSPTSLKFLNYHKKTPTKSPDFTFSKSNNTNLHFHNQTSCQWVYFDKKDHETYNIEGWHQRINHYNLQNETIQRRLSTFKKLNKKELTKEVLQKLRIIHQKIQNQNLQKVDKKKEITFIHIGKTGGSTLACNIREARKRMQDECSNYPLHIESTISQRITKRFHLRYPETDANTYIISTRNPIRRIQSWFLYEHSKNYGITSSIPKTIGHARPCGQIMFYLCFESFYDFVTYGLAGPRPYPSTVPNVSVHISLDQCKSYAWAVVQGFIASNFHNFWNYHKYTHEILQQKLHNTTRNIKFYIIRSEYLWDDWHAIDKLVSTDKVNYTTPKPVTWHSNKIKGNSTLLNKLPISNNKLTQVGLKNLCRALCDEIQLYKQLIQYGVNLSIEDKINSLNDLKGLCPLETSLNVRNCTY